MAKKKKLTDRQIANEFATMVMEDLKGLSLEEKKAKIKRFGKRLTKASARPSRATSSDKVYTSQTPAYARGR